MLNKDSTPCSRISVQVKIEDEKQDERSERSERYNRQRLAFLDRSFKDRGVRGIDFEWSRTLGGNVTTIQCTGNHGGFAHGQNPQAQLFFKSAGSRARVRVEFWWEGGDDEKNPMAIKAMMVRGPTPSFNGKRIKGSAEKGGAIFAESTYSTLHEEKVNSVDFDLDEAMGYDRERIAVRMLFSLYFPTFCGKLHFRVIPLTEHTEIMIVPLPWEDEKKSRGGPKVCDECRDILDAAVGVEALSFGKLDLSKSAILLDHDPVCVSLFLSNDFLRNLLLITSSHRYDIMERCRAIGARFTDPDFRPCDDSLRLEGERKPRHAENNPNPKDRGSPWDRVGNLHDCPDVFVDGVCCEDMSQGSLGNCWFIGQLSCLGFHDDILEALIEPNRWNPEGVYS